MRLSTFANTELTTQAQPLHPLGELGMVAGDELGPIIRDVALRATAHAGLLVAGNAAENRWDVISACGTAPSEDHLSVPARGSWFVGRAPESGRTVGEPIVMEENPWQAELATWGDRGSVVWASGAATGAGRGVAGASDPRSGCAVA